MYENNVDVTVREAFLFMVKVYSKPFPLVKKKKKIQHSHSLLLTKQKIFWRGTLHPNCLLTHSIQIKIQQAIVQNCLSKQKILQSTFLHYSSTQLLARKHEH